MKSSSTCRRHCVHGMGMVVVTMGFCHGALANEPVAFRITELDLVSPRIVSDAFLFCQDLTSTLNDLVIQPAFNDLSVNTIQTFTPLDPAGASSQWQAEFNADCTPGTNPLECAPDADDPAFSMGTALNQAAGTCYTADPAEVNERGGGSNYSPAVNAPAAPCYATDVDSVELILSGITIPLKGATVSATYTGNPVDGLVTGVVTGFISQEEAALTRFSDTVDLIGNLSLYSILNGGDRVVNGVEDACNIGFVSADDADLFEAETGFRFFFNFVAERVNWPSDIDAPVLLLKDGFEEMPGGG